MYPHVVTDLLVNCSAHIDVMEMEKLLRGEISFHLREILSQDSHLMILLSPDCLQLLR